MALIGDRGVGKTVVLNKVQKAVHDDLRWPVVAMQAVPQGGLLLPMAESIRHEAGSTWQRAGALVKVLDKEISVSANLLVVQARAKVKSGAAPPAASVAALERIFRAVGEAAQKRNVGVLITVDEAHVIPKTPDLAVLGAAIQLVTKRRQLPVAVLLAGLPELRRRFRGVGTFLERVEVREIGNLSRESTAYALVAPAAERGVSFEADALHLLLDRSGGYPYLVQLLGYRAWEAAGRRRQITLADAESGAQVAQREMDGTPSGALGCSDRAREGLRLHRRHPRSRTRRGIIHTGHARTYPRAALLHTEQSHREAPCVAGCTLRSGHAGLGELRHLGGTARP